MEYTNVDKLVALIKQRHQIILQGAPGTGKTYFAKIIAKELIKNQGEKIKPESITENDILELLHEGIQIRSASDYTIYNIEKIEARVVHLSGKSITPKKIPFRNIIDAYKIKKWGPNKIKNGLDSYDAALALYIYNNIGFKGDFNDGKYIKLVQFHPSYTYEDFVRGIEMQVQNGIPEYKSVDKLLARFAKEAQENWEYSKLDQSEVEKVLESKSIFEQFINYIQLKIDDEQKFVLTNNIYLFEYDDTRFKYKGDNWEAHFTGLNMKYSEIKKVVDSGLTERSEIKKIDGLESLTVSHATYYTKIVEEYNKFIKSYKPIAKKDRPVLKNYVLIIDEINRANLPSVLGELIYALEYRGEKLESMYAVDGDDTLVLPPNLYIIGTMNTADRSVGQIDYAIRRRFAFVEMLPKAILDESLKFDINLFKVVSKFFIKNVEEYISDPNLDHTVLERSEWLSDEFSPEDVWIGHSYFMMDKVDRDVRLNYEIKPILREYLKDGILKEIVDGKDTKTEINRL